MIIYEGPSRLDGAPIAMIVTGVDTPSGNGKTGPMIQTWIIRTDMGPLEASRTGADAAICGSCIHRGIATPERERGWAAERSCYVDIGKAPNGVFKAMQRGRYPIVTDPRDIRAIGADRAVRLGSYGDSGAVPEGPQRDLIADARTHTGYTHNGGPTDICMLSVDSLPEAENAWAHNIRTFRVTAPGEDKTSNEVWCPASEIGGYRATCHTCGLCRGSRIRAKSVAIPGHGPGRKWIEKRNVIPIRVAA